jgi:hypothetical protein
MAAWIQQPQLEVRLKEQTVMFAPISSKEPNAAVA